MLLILNHPQGTPWSAYLNGNTQFILKTNILPIGPKGGELEPYESQSQYSTHHID